MRTIFGVVLSLFFGWGTLACCESRRQPSPDSTRSELRPAPTSPKPVPKEEPRARPLMDLPASAYAAQLFPRDGGVLLVTPSLLVEIGEDGATEKHEVDLGRLQVLLGRRIAFVRGMKLWTISPEDLKEERRISLTYPPRALVPAGPRLAWTTRNESGQHLLQTESAGAVVTFFESAGELSSPVFHDEAIYFLERMTDEWRVGIAPLDGSQARFSTPQRSRIPPRLVAGLDGLYYYDGPERGVLRLTFDLEHDESHAPGLICSPMVVTDRVICAQVGGLVEVTHEGAEPRSLGAELDGPITTLAATKSRAYWVADRGRNRMSVRAVLLPDL